MDTFQVQIVDRDSGEITTVLLYDGIKPDEVKQLIGASFATNSPIVGLVDENSVYYPFSMLCLSPRLFNTRRLALVVEDPVAQSQQSGQNFEPSPTESEELVLTDENAERAFNILDKNGDGYLHKEEIVEVLTVAYNKFMETSARYSFAYSCLAAKDIAAATANALLNSVETSDGDYCLDFDDFCAWYLSAGANPLRELMVMALESIATTADLFGALSPKTARKIKARAVEGLEGAYDDEQVAAFAASCQGLLRLTTSSLTYLLDLLAVSAKGRSCITHDLYTKIFYVYMLQHNHQLTERDTDIVRVLDTLFDLLSTDSTSASTAGAGKVALLELGSLLCTVTNGKYLQSLKTLFDMYPDSHTGFVSEGILPNHLSQILRVVFYFNPAIAQATGCFPEDLACALASKVFLLVEANRKSKGKLSFEEFTECFLHGLMLGLNMLQIRGGFFYEYLERLMTYIGSSSNNNAARSGSGTRSNGSGISRRVAEEDEEEGEEEGEDVESYEDDDADDGDDDDAGDDDDTRDSESCSSGEGGSDCDGTSSDSRGDDVDTEAATGRQASMTEEDTLDDNMDLQSGVATASDADGDDNGEGGDGVQLEDSQVAASEVCYEGAAISVMEARHILGLTEYSSKVLCCFILQELADEKDGEVDQELLFRGLSKLIGERYVSATVLTRSKIDFILSRLFTAFDPDNSGSCSAVELGCGLLLFCGDDAMVRSRVAWEMLESDVAHGNPLSYHAVVRAVAAVIKAQVCLDPEVELEAVLSAVEVRANLEAVLHFPGQHLDRVVLNSAAAFEELFTNVLYMCQGEVMGLELEQYRGCPVRRATGSPKAFRVPSKELNAEDEDGEGVLRTGLTEEDEEFGDYGMVASDPELEDSSADEGEGRNSGNSKRTGSCNSLTLGTFSFDREEEDEEENNVYTNDKLFPPSAVVLELRAARAILGLENYSAEEMMASLAESSPGGLLSESGWLKWLNVLTIKAGTPEQDLSIAITLGNRLFEAFDCNGSDGSPVKGGPREAQVKYERIAAGLSFLCGGSPLEERLMVAFTVMDADSDGCITPTELLELIHSALIAISVCSRMVADKVILLGAPLAELAEAAAIEAISALNVDDTAAYITLEMLSDMSDDFLKLTALF